MINLMYAGNRKAFDGMLISILSIIKHTEQELNIFILTMDLQDIKDTYVPICEKERSYLESIVKEKNNNSRVVLIDVTTLYRQEMLSSVNKENFYTPYCLLRLFADEITLPDKIIYLDTDTMANGDINELFKIDVSGYEFAGVVDYLGKWFIRKDYINSGVLLLNMKKIKDTKLFRLARECCRTKKMAFPDQSALNNLVKDKLIIPTKFNSQRRLYEDTVIQHFCKSIRLLPIYHTINVKPWEVERVHKRLKIHDYDDILNDYLKRKENDL